MASSPDRPGEQPGGPDDEVAQRGPEPGVPAPRPERDELAKYLWWARFGGVLGLLVSVLAWVATGDAALAYSSASVVVGFIAGTVTYGVLKYPRTQGPAPALGPNARFVSIAVSLVMVVLMLIPQLLGWI